MPQDPSTLVAELKTSLTQQRFNRVAIHNYCRNAEYFLQHLSERGITLDAVTPDDVSNYLRLAVRRFRKRHGHPPAPRWEAIPRSGTHALLRHSLKRWPPEPEAADAGERLCREVLAHYETWLREERGLASASIYALMWEAKHFCGWYAMPALDAGLLAAAQAVEHYEMSRYGTLRTWAEELGLPDAAKLLQATLTEEQATDSALTKLAKSIINVEAEQGLK